MRISISELENSKNGQVNIEFSEVIDDLNTAIPVKAILLVKSLDKEYINVTGNVSATLSLECDNCLKKFEKSVSINIDETFVKHSLHEEYKEEVELKEGSFVEELNGAEEIDITDLIYQSVILNLPNKLVCDINCIGEEKIEQYIKKENSDPRLEIFKSIKIEKDD